MEEVKRASKNVEMINKMINNNLDMSNEKSEIINGLIELYNLKKLYYMNKIDNNSEINKTINKTLLDHVINELEKRFRDQNKKGNGMFTSEKKFAKLFAKLF